MANRRCFSVKKTQSYTFLAQSAGAQALYLAILGICDDDGIFQINFAKRIAGRRKQDIDALIENGYIAIIDDQSNIGYVVDWHSFNDLKADRSTPSVYRQALIDAFPNIENRLFTPKKNAFGIQNDSLNKTNKKDIKGKKTKQTKQFEQEFASIWSEYPRQLGKQKALNAYIRSRQDGYTEKEIVDGMHRYIELVKHEKRKERYIKAGGNFFLEELWRDDHSVKRDPRVQDDSDILGEFLT